MAYTTHSYTSLINYNGHIFKVWLDERTYQRPCWMMRHQDLWCKQQPCELDHPDDKVFYKLIEDWNDRHQYADLTFPEFLFATGLGSPVTKWQRMYFRFKDSLRIWL